MGIMFTIPVAAARQMRQIRWEFVSCKAFGNHVMSFTRRGFLSASAVLAALPIVGRAAQAAVPREADIVVIGAGAAGIAAARRVAAANRKVVLLEASPQ